jgi:hypothetical protein
MRPANNKNKKSKFYRTMGKLTGGRGPFERGIWRIPEIFENGIGDWRGWLFEGFGKTGVMA